MVQTAAPAASPVRRWSRSARRPAQQAAGDYPHLSQHQPETTLDPAELRDSKFAYALEVVLDGLATRMPPDPA